jgi:hypothetical protein
MILDEKSDGYRYYRFLIRIHVIINIIRNDLIEKKTLIRIIIKIGQQLRSFYF